MIRKNSTTVKHQLQQARMHGRCVRQGTAIPLPDAFAHAAPIYYLRLKDRMTDPAGCPT
jgi:hypothetical protein